MADRPILFSGPMVRALLSGRKTQTRRNIDQPFSSGYYQGEVSLDVIKATSRAPKAFRFSADAVGGGAVLNEVFEPRINEGDRLWVRENFRGSKDYDNYKPTTWSHWPVHYEADGEPDPRDELGYNGKLRPAIHLPRWASRLTLIVTDVRVERLQDCSVEDAISEGIERHHSGWKPYSTAFYEADGVTPANYHPDPRESYRSLWNVINGAGSWEANPWIVAYSFSTIFQNIDRISNG